MAEVGVVAVFDRAHTHFREIRLASISASDPWRNFSPRYSDSQVSGPQTTRYREKSSVIDHAPNPCDIDSPSPDPVRIVLAGAAPSVRGGSRSKCRFPPKGAPVGR